MYKSGNLSFLNFYTLFGNIKQWGSRGGLVLIRKEIGLGIDIGIRVPCRYLTDSYLVSKTIKKSLLARAVSLPVFWGLTQLYYGWKTL